MGNILKTGVLLFAVILSINSITGNSYRSLLYSPAGNTENAGSSSYIALKKINLFCLHRQSESVGSPVNGFHPGDFKNSSRNTATHTLPGETRIENVDSGYFSYSINIVPGLSTEKITFPFHYFW